MTVAAAADFPWPVVLFDLDGTLVDSASDIATAVNRMLAELGHPQVAAALVRSWIGDGARELVASALRNAGDGRDVDTVMPRFMQHENLRMIELVVEHRQVVAPVHGHV